MHFCLIDYVCVEDQLILGNLGHRKQTWGLMESCHYRLLRWCRSVPRVSQRCLTLRIVDSSHVHFIVNFYVVRGG